MNGRIFWSTLLVLFESLTAEVTIYKNAETGEVNEVVTVIICPCLCQGSIRWGVLQIHLGWSLG